MKRILFAILFISTAGMAQQTDFKPRAIAIFENMRNLKFDKVHDELDSSISDKLDTARLRHAWENLLSVAGKFLKVSDITQDHQPMFDVVLQNCQFEKKKINVKIVFAGKEGKVKGISFLSGDPIDTYRLPEYIKNSDITERQIFLNNNTPDRLVGIITAPKKEGRFPVVILIHGSGANDKDETLGPLKIFKDLSGGLASKGLVVYRYDKRSRAHPSNFSLSKAYNLEQEALADAGSAIDAVKQDPSVDSTKIYLCGHGFGGTLLPLIAEGRKDIKGLILLAANGRPLNQILLDMTTQSLSMDSSNSVDKQKALLVRLKSQSDSIDKLDSQYPDSLNLLRLPVSYWKDVKNYDAIKSANKFRNSMLILNGGRDFQINAEDLSIWKKGLSVKKNVTFKSYPDLNHFFVSGKGKSTTKEYFQTGNVSVTIVNDIFSWIETGKLP